MNKILKVGLFLSSFSPLFILIMVKELIQILNGNWSFNFLNTFILIALASFIFYGLMSFKIIFNKVIKTKSQKIQIISKKNITDEHFLGYFSIFVLFAVTFEIQMYSMAVIFFIILGLIGRVYIKNDMFYINPLINLLGYSFYDIEAESFSGKVYKVRVFHKGRLKIQSTYLMQDSHSNFIFLKDNEL